MQSAKVFADGAPLNRARCTTAGWILLAIVNLLLTFMVRACSSAWCLAR